MMAVQFTPIGPDVAWAWLNPAGGSTSTTYPQRIVRTTDGGASWDDVTPPGFALGSGDSYFSSALFLGTTDAWVTFARPQDGAPQSLLRTTDGGREWSSLGRLPSPYCIVQFVDVSDGWCVEVAAALGSDQVVVYRTSDGARHWSLISQSASPTGAPGSPGSLPLPCSKRVGFVSDREGWASFVCNGGGPLSPLYRTSDGGHRWVAATVAPPPAGYRPVNGAPASWDGLPTFSGSIGAAALSDRSNGRLVSLVYVTIDGDFWQAVKPPGEPRNWGIDLIGPRDWKLVLEHTVLGTSDGGRTWKRIRSDLNFPPEAVPDFATSQVGWYPENESSSPVEYRTTDGGATWSKVMLPSASVLTS
jgi:photosystem II stability/assembly factor-like uncharacterized protein